MPKRKVTRRYRSCPVSTCKAPSASGLSTSTHCLPVRVQWSLTRQYAPWLTHPVWQMT